MSNERTLTDFNRLEANLHEPQVKTVVPEHFKEQYPKLIDFLEAYYDYLDSDGQPTHNLKKMFTIRDPGSTDDEFLDLLFQEKTFSADTFPFPRFAYLQIPGLLNSKGTKISIDSFFRYFQGTDVEQILPRNSMFIVGQSEIGAESLRFIQDSYFYQVYSILLRTNVPPTEWFNLYKNYLHPAGFAIFTETLFELLPTNSQLAASMPLALVDSDIAVTSFEFSADVFGDVFTSSSITGIDSSIVSMGDSGVRVRLDPMRISDSDKFGNPPVYRSFNLAEDSLGNIDIDTWSTQAIVGFPPNIVYTYQYNSLADILNTNSPTFDDSAPLHGNNIRLTDTIQTMDKDVFPFYDSVGTDVP
jgi:hypothetical protein